MAIEQGKDSETNKPAKSAPDQYDLQKQMMQSMGLMPLQEPVVLLQKAETDNLSRQYMPKAPDRSTTTIPETSSASRAPNNSLSWKDTMKKFDTGHPSISQESSKRQTSLANPTSESQKNFMTQIYRCPPPPLVSNTLFPKTAESSAQACKGFRKPTPCLPREAVKYVVQVAPPSSQQRIYLPKTTSKYPDPDMVIGIAEPHIRISERKRMSTTEDPLDLTSKRNAQSEVISTLTGENHTLAMDLSVKPRPMIDITDDDDAPLELTMKNNSDNIKSKDKIDYHTMKPTVPPSPTAQHMTMLQRSNSSTYSKNEYSNVTRRPSLPTSNQGAVSCHAELVNTSAVNSPKGLQPPPAHRQNGPLLRSGNSNVTYIPTKNESSERIMTSLSLVPQRLEQPFKHQSKDTNTVHHKPSSSYTTHTDIRHSSSLRDPSRYPVQQPLSTNKGYTTSWGPPKPHYVIAHPGQQRLGNLPGIKSPTISTASIPPGHIMVAQSSPPTQFVRNEHRVPVAVSTNPYIDHSAIQAPAPHEVYVVQQKQEPVYIQRMPLPNNPRNVQQPALHVEGGAQEPVSQIVYIPAHLIHNGPRPPLIQPLTSQRMLAPPSTSQQYHSRSAPYGHQHEQLNVVSYSQSPNKNTIGYALEHGLHKHPQSMQEKVIIDSQQLAPNGQHPSHAYVSQQYLPSLPQLQPIPHRIPNPR